MKKWKKWKNEKIDTCQDQEGRKGRGVDLMHAMHFDAFSIHNLLRFKIFCIYFLDLILFLHLHKFWLLFFIPFWNYYRCGNTSKLLFGRFFFSFSIICDNMAPTHDSDTKNLLCVSDFHVKNKILWHLPTLWHVWDMSETFPTKPSITRQAYICHPRQKVQEILMHMEQHVFAVPIVWTIMYSGFAHKIA